MITIVYIIIQYEWSLSFFGTDWYTYTAFRSPHVPTVGQAKDSLGYVGRTG